jgi:hypothetical protein
VLAGGQAGVERRCLGRLGVARGGWACLAGLGAVSSGGQELSATFEALYTELSQHREDGALASGSGLRR